MHLIGEIIPYGVGVALSPLPVIATVLLLMAPTGARGAAALLAARVLGLGALITVSVLLIDLIDTGFGSTLPAAVVQLAVGAADVGVGGSILAAAVFVVLACAGIALPTASAVILGARITPTLLQTRTWLVRNQQLLIAIVLLVVGVLLIGAGIAEL